MKAPTEVNEVKDLFKSVRDLAKTLAGAHLDSGLDAVYLRIVCPADGIDCLDVSEKHTPGSSERGGGPGG